eukprot:SAG31_NODE_48106_length_199_cov_20.720000_1_plen_37_part_01
MYMTPSRAPDRPGGKKLNWLDGVAQTCPRLALDQVCH